jgi:hypothetical protein
MVMSASLLSVHAQRRQQGEDRQPQQRGAVVLGGAARPGAADRENAAGHGRLF